MSFSIDRWIACAVGVAVFGVVSTAGTAAAQSRRALAQLGQLDPPRYAAPLVRAGDPAPVFEEGIRAYGQKQYQRAADLFRRFVTAEPDDPAANFFLAATLMMVDDVGEAEDRLGVVLAAGETRFERAARFVLAKAAIRQGNLDAADRELSRLADGADHYALDAAGLLPKVRALKKRR
jgi:predicted Zn-dependent protease